MTVIRFLSDYADLFLKRALADGITCTVLYNQSSAELDDGSTGVVSMATITGPNGGSLDISVGFPLDMESKHQYVPELTDEQYALFKAQVAA